MKSKTTLPKDRLSVLEKRQNLKMARSAHSYVRGNTVKFYEWLTSANASRLPQGPAIWICGDCHVGNLGPLASADGRVEIAIRDLDQTVIGNPAHDLIRLGLSLATAARSSDLPGVTTARMLEAMLTGYQDGILRSKGNLVAAGNDIEPVKVVLRKALKREWRHLASERIAGVSPTIPLGKSFWPLSDAEKTEIKRLFDKEEVRLLITSLQQRDTDDDIDIADSAYWMKGCSSLGGIRFAVLVKVGKKKGIAGFSLIDIKEAAKTAAPRASNASLPRNNAQRIVQGACNISPFLGMRMMAARLCDRPVFVRELLPQDLKLEIENISRKEAVATARYLAEVVGKAHGRQMSSGDRKDWTSALRRNRSKNIDTPSWLWSSVIELIAIHEKAYLDHCRKFAMGTLH